MPKIHVSVKLYKYNNNFEGRQTKTDQETAWKSIHCSTKIKKE